MFPIHKILSFLILVTGIHEYTPTASIYETHQWPYQQTKDIVAIKSGATASTPPPPHIHPAKQHLEGIQDEEKQDADHRSR